VLTVLKFSPSSHTLGDFIEVVVNKSSTLDSLRDLLAERDPDIAASSEVALGSPDKLITGKYLRDLAGTVCDMECLDWDWDSSTGWFEGKNNTFSLGRDGDVYYYKDNGETAIPPPDIVATQLAAVLKDPDDDTDDAVAKFKDWWWTREQVPESMQAEVELYELYTDAFVNALGCLTGLYIVPQLRCAEILSHNTLSNGMD
jgi:hypothetical protein